MTVEIPVPTAQRAPAPAKLRILATANDLFYLEGIRSVGIDRLISESAVTKATFYKHYRSKDNLVVDYINGRADASVSEIESLIDAASAPSDVIQRFTSTIATEVSESGFRGCAFLNAAAEFSDSAHPVRRIVAEHRDWYTARLADLARSVGHPVPGDAADELMLARDGAMVGGYAGDAVAAIAALHRVVDHVLGEATRELDATLA